MFVLILISILMDVNLQAEMEMVARGLAKHLKLEQREFLMNMLVGFCDEQSRKIAAEALGLVGLFGPYSPALLFLKPNLAVLFAKSHGMFDFYI